MRERDLVSWRSKQGLGRVAAGFLLFAAGCTPGNTPPIPGSSSSGRGFTEDCKIPAHIRAMLPESIAKATEVACSGGQTTERMLIVTPTRNIPDRVPSRVIVATPTPEIRNLSYVERCTECGAIFKVDRLEVNEKNFRVRVTIENTGEYGNLQLVLDRSSVFTLDLAQASKYKAGFDRAFRDGTQEKLLGSVITKSGVRLHAEPEGGLPKVLRFKDQWSGWFRADSPLPKEAVVLILYLGNINREKADKNGKYETYWASYHENQPFIEIPLPR